MMGDSSSVSRHRSRSISGSLWKGMKSMFSRSSRKKTYLTTTEVKTPHAHTTDVEQDWLERAAQDVLHFCNSQAMDIEELSELYSFIQPSSIQSFLDRFCQQNSDTTEGVYMVAISLSAARGELTFMEAFESSLRFLLSKNGGEIPTSTFVRLYCALLSTHPEAFRYVLCSIPARTRFLKFLEEEFSEENLKFWVDVQHYKLTWDQNSIILGRDIIREYILESSPKPVNIDCTTRSVIIQQYDICRKTGIYLWSHLFDIAVVEIERMMEGPYARMLSNHQQTEQMAVDTCQNILSYKSGEYITGIKLEAFQAWIQSENHKSKHMYCHSSASSRQLLIESTKRRYSSDSCLRRNTSGAVICSTMLPPKSCVNNMADSREFQFNTNASTKGSKVRK